MYVQYYSPKGLLLTSVMPFLVLSVDFYRDCLSYIKSGHLKQVHNHIELLYYFSKYVCT